ncbi:MAG TPA: phosphopantetheine-binding protein [Oligoflexia bacterium]|nr:phosphopantetheine-binding protein [Oligoflexia bacterium]HMP48140.1 phosphopantetheine-binding protein [Oligoflexia bacterium]
MTDDDSTQSVKLDNNKSGISNVSRPDFGPIETRAKVLLTEMFGVEEGKILPTASLVDDLGLDSIDTIDLLSRLNDEYLIDASPFDFEGCSTLEAFLVALKDVEAKSR